MAISPAEKPHLFHNLFLTVKAFSPNLRLSQNDEAKERGVNATLNSIFFILYSQSDNITTTPSPVDTINSQVTSDNSLKPDASSYAGSPSISSGIQTYLQRVHPASDAMYYVLNSSTSAPFQMRQVEENISFLNIHHRHIWRILL